jgi:hypothetical protein
MNRRPIVSRHSHEMVIEIYPRPTERGIYLCNVYTDKGDILDVYSVPEHDFFIKSIYRKLNPSKFIKVKLVKNVGESNIIPTDEHYSEIINKYVKET